MDYVLKVSNKKELMGNVLFVDEYIGAHADPFLQEVLQEFPQHQIISYHKRLAEYEAGKRGISLLEANPAEQIEIDAEAKVVLIDGWRHRKNKITKSEIVLVGQKNREIGKIARTNKIIFIVNRSIEHMDYREAYKAYGLVKIQALAIATAHTHRMDIAVREKAAEVCLLYNHAAPHRYTVNS